MNTLDTCIYLYNLLGNKKGVHPYFLTPLRRCVRYYANSHISKYIENIPKSLSKNQSDIIISLTSFPKRIDHIHLVIQCMLIQSILPKKIILWLSKEQFNGIELPENLTKLENHIFEIRLVEGDLRSHKKYFYALSEYPDSKILLIDDDIYYPTDMIEQMIEASEKYPDTVICRYGSIMKFKHGKLLPYNDWWDEISSECNNQNFFFGSGGGTLIKREWLFKDALDMELATKLTPLADDVWLNAMVNLQGTPKHKIKFGLILPIKIENNQKLSTENVDQDQNTIQIKNITDYYNKRWGLNPFAEQNL